MEPAFIQLPHVMEQAQECEQLGTLSSTPIKPYTDVHNVTKQTRRPKQRLQTEFDGFCRPVLMLRSKG